MQIEALEIRNYRRRVHEGDIHPHSSRHYEEEALMAPPRLAVDPAVLEAFCLRNRIRRLSLFGSVLRDSAGPESDVDLLVEFEPGATPGLIGLAAMEAELSEILGKRADLRTPHDLSRHFRDEVLRTAAVQYAGE